MRLTLISLLVLPCLACAHALIPGTDVRDTKANREVYEVIEQLREALIARNAGAVMALIADDYFEAMGTADPNDDYDFAVLRDKVLPELLAATQEVQLTFEVYAIEVTDDRARADVRYHARAHMNLPSGNKWASNKDFHRIELARRNGSWRVLSGL